MLPVRLREALIGGLVLSGTHFYLSVNAAAGGEDGGGEGRWPQVMKCWNIFFIRKPIVSHCYTSHNSQSTLYVKEHVAPPVFGFSFLVLFFCFDVQ